MAVTDYDSSLPVRTETAGDVKVQLVDKTTVGQAASVDADGRQAAMVYGIDPATAQKEVLVSEAGEVVLNGDYDGTTNTKPSSAAIIASDRSASPGVATQNLRPTAIVGESDSTCLDVALHDASGNAYDAANPLQVVVNETAGVEVCNYDDALAVAAEGTSTHTYTPGAECAVYTLLAAGSGKMKIEVKSGPTGSTTTKMVAFNSTANPLIQINLKPALMLGASDILEIVKKNEDKQAQDLYSTVLGVK
jgi:hypothetical protein